MNALIVYAHPEPKSMNGALRHAALRVLTQAGWQVEVSDLHAQNFRPTAGWEDFTHPVSPGRLGYAHEQRYAAKGGHYSADILTEQERIRRADLIIFQFPLWWYAVPAILKGWADRVLANGFAYDEQHMFENGLLRGKRAMLSFTTGGTSAELMADRKHTGTVDEFMRPFSGGVLKFTGMQVLPPFISHAPASLDEDGRRSQILQYAPTLLGGHASGGSQGRSWRDAHASGGMTAGLPMYSVLPGLGQSKRIADVCPQLEQ